MPCTFRLVQSLFLSGMMTCAAGMTIAAPAAELLYIPESTKKICQLTGDFDLQRGQPTLSLITKRYGITGTDLGSSFEL